MRVFVPNSRRGRLKGAPAYRTGSISCWRIPFQPALTSARFSYQPTKIVLRRPLKSAQYVSIKYTDRLAEAGIEPSVGSVGDFYDNALAETINGLYKAEVIHRRGPWRNFEAVEFATLDWVDWFNNRRLLEPIGFIPPAEAEERYFAMLNHKAIVTGRLGVRLLEFCRT